MKRSKLVAALVMACIGISSAAWAAKVDVNITKSPTQPPPFAITVKGGPARVGDEINIHNETDGEITVRVTYKNNTVLLNDVSILSGNTASANMSVAGTLNICAWKKPKPSEEMCSETGVGVPGLSQGGLIALGVVLLAAGAVFTSRRRVEPA